MSSSIPRPFHTPFATLAAVSRAERYSAAGPTASPAPSCQGSFTSAPPFYQPASRLPLTASTFLEQALRFPSSSSASVFVFTGGTNSLTVQQTQPPPLPVPLGPQRQASPQQPTVVKIEPTETTLTPSHRFIPQVAGQHNLILTPALLAYSEELVRRVQAEKSARGHRWSTHDDTRITEFAREARSKLTARGHPQEPNWQALADETHRTVRGLKDREAKLRKEAAEEREDSHNKKRRYHEISSDGYDSDCATSTTSTESRPQSHRNRHSKMRSHGARERLR